MAMFLDQFRTKIEILLSGVGKYVSDSKRTKAATDQSVKSVAKWGASLKGVLIGLGALVATLGVVMIKLKKYVKLAGIQELAETKLAESIANVKKAREGDVDMLVKQASALSNVTAIGDEEILTFQALLGTFQLTGDQIFFPFQP